MTVGKGNSLRQPVTQSIVSTAWALQAVTDVVVVVAFIDTSVVKAAAVH